jgi:hypothetical protein
MKVTMIVGLLLSLALLGCAGDDDGLEADSGVGIDLGDLVGDDASSQDGEPEIENPCGDWKCTGPDCGKLVAMPGPHAPASKDEGEKYGYVLISGKEYHWVRKDLGQLLAWAICQVRVKFDVTPLAVADMSQQDGKTPGVDKGRPRHPTSTHVNGRDIDVAYYQTDGANNYQIICGDGSDENGNGQMGQYNDGYFCTTSENIVDWGPQVWFLAKLIESNKARVFGVDQMLVKDMGAKLKEFYDNGEISHDLYMKFNNQIAWGASGGWQFHHHHIHLSFVGYAP